MMPWKGGLLDSLIHGAVLDIFETSADELSEFSIRFPDLALLSELKLRVLGIGFGTCMTHPLIVPCSCSQ